MGALTPDGLDRVQHLEERLTTLEGLVQRLLQQQATAETSQASPPVQTFEGATDPLADVVPPAVAGDDVVRAAGSVLVATVTANQTVVAIGVSSFPTGYTIFVVSGDALAIERARARANLVEFMKFKPPSFNGEGDNSWAVEKWVDHMQKLFCDLYIEEKDKIPITAHFLEGDANRWWSRLLDRCYSTKPLPSWGEFNEMLFNQYFMESTKQSLERDLERLLQGDRTIQKYERDFSRIVNLIPRVVRLLRSTALSRRLVETKVKKRNGLVRDSMVSLQVVKSHASILDPSRL
uniref:Retrotransposon gag domain-containing protein n=1 Tax=Ananas comosus var. bracteatus TaxID=296719 RepID=A0A6V7NFE1_ANACO|nr:unnamed protein product [Ananas comosus var. bracteatus]